MEQQSQSNIDEKVVKILHIDDNFAMTKAYDKYLEELTKYSFLTAHNEEEAIKILQNNEIALAILDLNLKEKNGFDLIPNLKKENSELKIIIYSTYTELYYINQAKENGVQGYVTKDLESDSLLEAINMVLNGEVYFPQSENYSDEEIQRNFEIYSSLSEKEKEIFSLLVQFETTQKISDMLKKSKRTVENQKAMIFNKFYIDNTLDLFKIAKNLGIIENF